MRLMEQEGIYFHFEHEEGSHKLVLCDDTSCHSPLPGKPTIKYYGLDAATVADEEHFRSWQVLEEVNSGEYITDDYDFINPRADLKTKRKNPLGHAHDSWERYTWPGGYVKYGDGETYTGVRLESLEAEHERTQARPPCGRWRPDTCSTWSVARVPTRTASTWPCPSITSSGITRA